MCQPISWIEKQGHIFFLTSKDLRGKTFAEFKKYNSYWAEDILGHGAIKYFYPESKGGTNFEVNDLTKPKAFPEEIVIAMKKGLFRGLFADEKLLLKRALAEYKKIEQGAYAECKKIEQGADAEYIKIEQGAFWELWSKPENRIKAWR